MGAVVLLVGTACLTGCGSGGYSYNFQDYPNYYSDDIYSRDWWADGFPHEPQERRDARNADRVERGEFGREWGEFRGERGEFRGEHGEFRGGERGGGHTEHGGGFGGGHGR